MNHTESPDPDEVGIVERGIAETMTKVPGGEWRDESERKAEVDMWLRALERMVPDE